MNSSLRLRLELSLCMRSLFHSNLPGKLSNCKTNVQNSHNVKLKSKISNSSFNFDLKTSCALPPYYSLELAPISSTSHSNLFGGPGSRILMICCVSRAKMYFKHWKIDVSCSFALFFSIFWFSQFSMIFQWFHNQFQFPGWISCPGVVSDRPGIEFSLKMAILLRM